MDSEAPTGRGRTLGRYVLFDAFASGGMATVHFARLVGPAGFSRTVAMKRLHAQFADSPDFVRMLLDEARITGRIRHPNVVPTLDVVLKNREVFLVMEYVHGQSFSRLLVDQAEPPDPSIVSALVTQTLLGLHTAHDTRGEDGESLGIVHRDATPHNVMVDAQGTARVIDFGVAKAQSVLHTTGEGRFKGKISYMSPEQLEGKPFDRRVDVFSVSVMLWESLTRKRLFTRESPGATVQAVLKGDVPSVRVYRPSLPEAIDAVLKRGLAPDPGERFQTALEMAEAVADALPAATQLDVARWVQTVAGAELESRARMLHEIEHANDFDLDEIRQSVERILLASDTPSSVRAAPPPELGVDAADAASAEVLQEAVRTTEDTGSGNTERGAATSHSHPPPPATRAERSWGTWSLVGGAAVAGLLLVALRPSREPVIELHPGLRQVLSGVGFDIEDWTKRLREERTAAPEPAPADGNSSASVNEVEPRTRVTAGRVAARRKPSDPAKPGCDPPWTLDAKGRKRFKTECF